MSSVQEATKAEQLEPEVRAAVRDLILSLADSKRLLGMRFGNWILGAPELEAGIACASMAQDEWGHARLLYALLRDFGDEVEHIEHGRTAAEYRCMGTLDAEPQSWPELVALNVLVDGALTLQLETLASSSYQPLRQRVQKLVEEEQFHAAHGAAWLRRIAGGSAEGHAEVDAALRKYAPAVLAWFGPDSPRSRMLLEAGIATAAGSDMRTLFNERVSKVLTAAFVDADVLAAAPDFTGWDEGARRVAGTAPDDRTIAQVRGDRNRAFLMD